MGLGLDAAPGCLDDLPHDREPQARSGEVPRRGRAVEAVEDVRQVLRVDPRTVVTDRDLAVRRDADLDRPLGRTPLRGVVEQVADRALQGRGDALDGARAGLELEP